MGIIGFSGFPEGYAFPILNRMRFIRERTGENPSPISFRIARNRNRMLAGTPKKW
jgi:hypothetical protein